MEEVTKITLPEVLNKKKDDSFNEFKIMMQNHRFDFDEQDPESGKTLLMQLIESQSPTEFIWFCLEYFADTSVQDKSGNTALHYAFASPNRQYAYILLLFNADTKIKNNDEKEPHEMSPSGMLKIEDIFKLYETIDSLKLVFARLTRQRRDFAKEIFTFIEGGKDMKGVTSQKLTYFNMWLNDENFNDAQTDANVFFEESRLPSTTLEIYYEEFIIALTRIAKLYEVGKLDEFFELYKQALQSNRKLQSDF
jgi:ankyrin repeat protein